MGYELPPDVRTNIKDASFIEAQVANNIYGIQAVSLRGTDEPQLFSSWEAYKEQRGGYVPGSKDAHIIERLLRAGAKLRVSRLFHYTDVTDKATAVGTKASGTITVSSNSAVFNAEAVGVGYNGIKVETRAAISGKANYVDIIITPVGYDAITIVDVPNNPSAEQKANVNSRMPYVQIGAVTNLIPVGTATLASGAQDISLIDDTDRIGAVEGNTGLRAFDAYTDIRMIINWNSSPVMDVALADYCKTRKDIRFTIFTKSISNYTDAQDAVKYRSGITPYTHTAIDTVYGRIIAPPMIKITNPENLNETILIPAIDTGLGSLAKKDEVAPWLCAAQEPYCFTIANNGLVYDLGSPALDAPLGELYGAGVNTILKKDGNIKYYGNKSLYKNPTSLLSLDNVCDLVIWIQREFSKEVRKEHFKPNAPEFWRKIYMRVKPLIRRLERENGIYEGEGTNWNWIGDQLAQNVRDVKFNKLTDIQARKYKWRFVFVPVVPMEYINGEIMATDFVTLDAIMTGNNIDFNVAT